MGAKTKKYLSMSEARKLVARQKGVKPESVNNQEIFDTGKFQVKTRPTNDNPTWKLKII